MKTKLSSIGNTFKHSLVYRRRRSDKTSASSPSITNNTHSKIKNKEKLVPKNSFTNLFGQLNSKNKQRQTLAGGAGFHRFEFHLKNIDSKIKTLKEIEKKWQNTSTLSE